jgi:hypothetical protein
MFHFTFSNYGRSAKQHEITVEYSSFSSEYSCQNMSYTLAGKTYPGLIKLISNNKWNLRIMIEKKKNSHVTILKRLTVRSYLWI